MILRLYQVDAFHHQVLKGNPAAVIPLHKWLPDEQLQAIAQENNLSETAYFLPPDSSTGLIALRWFTPNKEVRLCGHATLATAHVLFTEIGMPKAEISFSTLSGPLQVSRQGEMGNYRMNFPADHPTPTDVSPLLVESIGYTPEEVYAGKDDLLTILPSEAALVELSPNFSTLAQLEVRGLIVSAPGDDVDFVSRCFYPRYGINEDPVTGSAHTLMTPYWAKRLGKTELSATQISKRQGLLKCHYHGERVWLDGQAVTYLRGEVNI